MKKRILIANKFFLALFIMAVLIVLGNGVVKANQETDTAGASLGKEYQEQPVYDEIQVYQNSEAEFEARTSGGWRQDSKGWWFQYPDGSYPVKAWLQIGNIWYYFNANGYMVTGSQYIDGQWYYFDQNGQMLTGWQKNSGGWWYYNTKGAYVPSNFANGTIKGIDVSYYQGNIDWRAVKNDGISFAFLRVGRSYYDNGYHHYVDQKFEEYATDANAANMPIGVYIYSKARTTADAVLDAEYVVSMIQGYTISYPVVIDLEDDSQTDLSKQQIGAIAKAFCDEIRKWGYNPMVYCNENWYKNYIDVSQISNEEMWVARYNSYYDTNISRGIWQCSSTTRISGISGNVDLDFASKDYTQSVTYTKGKWKCINQTWYFLNPNGQYVTGWQFINGSWYYFAWNGAMTTNWQNINNHWYYMDSNGRMTIGWQYVGGRWYYMSRNGVMTTGWQCIGGSWYYMNGSGSMTTGWQYIGGRWYYMNGNGVMTTGWQYIGGRWYYMNANGVMMTGWQYINGSWYYMNGEGIMLIGHQYINRKWYYLDASGVWRY